MRRITDSMSPDWCKILLGPADPRACYSDNGRHEAGLEMTLPPAVKALAYDLIRRISKRLGWPILKVISQGRPLWDHTLPKSKGRRRPR